jgi:UDP-glucose 4-epimerase
LLRSLVVGGNGFIGTHVVDSLIERGYFVRIFDRSTNTFRVVPTVAEYIQGDLGSRSLVREAVEGMDVVFHLVSTTLPQTSNEDPIYDVHSNLVGTLQLLEACVEAGVRKMVFASSGGTVYGLPRTIPIAEEHPTAPLTSYGIVKLASEKYFGLFYHLHGLDYVALRISNPYGPYQDPDKRQGAVAVFLNHLYAGRPIIVWGDGRVVRDYLYVADLAEAIVLAAETDTRRKVLNVGSGTGTSLNELVALMAEVTGEHPEVEYQPRRAFDVPANVLDVRLVEEELGWSARTELAEGVDRTWGWIRNLTEESAEQKV